MMLKELQIFNRTWSSARLEGYVNDDGTPSFELKLFIKVYNEEVDFDIDRNKAIEIIAFLKEFYGIE